MPKVVDDMKSNDQAGHVVVSNFDDNTYATSEGDFESFCETILTTNYIWDTRIVSRYEKTFIVSILQRAVLNRMIVMEFVKKALDRSQEEKENTEESFRRVMSSPGTPIITVMSYCHYVQTEEWDEAFKHFKTVAQETHNLDDRETRYSVNKKCLS